MGHRDMASSHDDPVSPPNAQSSSVASTAESSPLSSTDPPTKTSTRSHRKLSNDAAAIIIQTEWRRYTARQFYEFELLVKALMIARQIAAVEVQRRWVGYRARLLDKYPRKPPDTANHHTSPSERGSSSSVIPFTITSSSNVSTGITSTGNGPTEVGKALCVASSDGFDANVHTVNSSLIRSSQEFSEMRNEVGCGKSRSAQQLVWMDDVCDLLLK